MLVLGPILDIDILGDTSSLVDTATIPIQAKYL